jgi:transposase
LFIRASLEAEWCQPAQFSKGGHRMRVHANAPLGPKGRLTMVRRVLEDGWSLAVAAEAAGVSERTCSKWVARYRAEGEAGLLDRSSAPRSIPHRTSEELVEAIVALRRLRMTGAEIAFCLAMALSTVSAVLARVGLGAGSSCTCASTTPRAWPMSRS